jgi:hypothetical protein
VVGPHRQRPAHGGDLVAELVALVVGAHRDRHERAQVQALGPHAAGAQPGAQAAGDDGEHDVVDRAAELVLDRLEVGEVVRDPGDPPVRRRRHLQRRRRRGGEGGLDEDVADALRALEDRADRGLRVQRAGGGAERDAGRAGGDLHRGLGLELDVGGRRRGLPRRLGLLDLARLGRDVEEHREDVDARHAVDERVVGLRDDREAVVLQAVDEPHLPQRLGAVELLAEDARARLRSWSRVPGCGSAVWRTW